MSPAHEHEPRARPVFPEPLTLSPTLFPEGVVVRAIRLGEPHEETLGFFEGIALPERLATAVIERRVHFLAGRHCAREALLELSPENAHMPVLIGENREPVWPFGIRGSISHTKRYAAAVVASMAHMRGLGIDVERWMKPDAPQRLGDHITLKGELEDLEGSELSPSEVLTVVFSAKESLFKALYGDVGRYFGFQDARITHVDIEKGTLEGQLEATLTNELTMGFRFSGRVERVDGGVVTGIAWKR
jgi:enterobactin synthetase component D